MSYLTPRQHQTIASNLQATPTGYCTGHTANQVKDSLRKNYDSWKRRVQPGLEKALQEDYDFATHFQPLKDEYKNLTESYANRRHERPQRFKFLKRKPKTLDPYEKIFGADEHGVRLKLLKRLKDAYDSKVILVHEKQDRLQSEYREMKIHTDKLRTRLAKYGIVVPKVEGHNNLPADLTPKYRSSASTSHHQGQSLTSGSAAPVANRLRPEETDLGKARSPEELSKILTERHPHHKREDANERWAKKSHAAERS